MALRRISTRRRKTKIPIIDGVGFSTLPEQVHRKSLKRGFEFTLLVTGESSLGKTTLINSLFLTDFQSPRNFKNSSTTSPERTLEIRAQTINLEEKGVRLRLTIVDTPGFGDAVNSNNCWLPIVDYIDEQHRKYYVSESGYGLERRRIQDTRVHCCLYFIPPHVRGLRRLDILTMKNLQDRVNIVPVIAKADSLTKNELKKLKAQIMNDIEENDIKIYEFPEPYSDDDADFKQRDEEIKSAIPFAIISSNTIIEYGEKRIRGRAYPWGIVDIESEHFCDFSKLRTFLCSSHMQDLKDVTHDLYYENYRTKLLQTLSPASSNLNLSTDNSTSTLQNEQDDDEKDRLIHQKDVEIQNMQTIVETIKKNMLEKSNAKSTVNNQNFNYIKKNNLKSLSKQLSNSNANINSNNANAYNKRNSLNSTIIKLLKQPIDSTEPTTPI